MLQQQLVPVDLSSYEQRFSAPSGCIGAIQDVMALTSQQFPFQDFMYRYENDPIAVLYLDNPVAPAPTAPSIDELTPIAQYMADEMNRNVKSKEALAIKQHMQEYRTDPNTLCTIPPGTAALMNIDLCEGEKVDYRVSHYVAALLLWTNQVYQDGPWDHKPMIAKKFHPRHPREQQYHAYSSPSYKSYVYYYDVWSNMHYGYVGTAAGLSEAELLDGAGLEQIVSTSLDREIPDYTPNVSWPRAFDGKGDREAIEIGIKLYKSYPMGVTTQHLVDEILNAKHVRKNIYIPTKTK